MPTVQEHDLVALRADHAEHGLLTGDTGTVVSVHDAGTAFTVEFLTVAGDTVALLTLPASQLRAVAGDDITQTRPLASAA